MTFIPVFLAMFLQTAVSNPSLFSDTASNVFLFRDFKARHVNDILTIQIVESSTASNSANTSTQRQGEVNASMPALFGLENKTSALNFANILSGASNLNFAGQGSTSRTGQLQAFVSARVSQVLPNGDLMIEGTKEVTINRERQILTIRGLVRTRDITPNNVIFSTAIANMEVKFDGKGIVSDANKPGFLFRLFQWITPF
ncbi:MAG: flagellar basal body L-ring protein FlgH [Acidobacteria bacterium]|nr:flagellar basal body L-ring protein FlgH [Acidobacteriota bacterium]